MPIKYFLLCIFSFHSIYTGWFFPSFEKKRPFCLVIAPSGDAHTTGRTIDDTTERALSYSIAEQIKKNIELQFPLINVTLSRTPGQTIAPLQTASFANRTQADLVVTISCYTEKEIKNHINIFQFSYNQEFITKIPELALHSYDNAYRLDSGRTTRYAQLIFDELNAYGIASTAVCGPYKIPYKPLIGIQTPALGFEIGIKSKQESIECCHALTKSITRIISDY